MPSQTTFFESVQGLRALAAMAVVVYHILIIYGIPGVGAFGVDIFFVISGFIMAMIAAQSPDRFFLRRMVRVIPLYWVGTFGVFGVAVVMPQLLNSTTADFGNLLKSLFFIPYEKENGLVQPILFLGWTLNYEMYFYAVFQIALLINRRFAAAICAGLICVLPVLHALIGFENVVLQFYSHSIVFEFLYGMAIYYAWRKIPAFAGKALVMLGLAAALFLALPVLEFYNKGWEIPRAVIYGLPAMGIVALAVFASGRLRVPAGTVLLGNASYSLYLLHPYVIQVTEKLILKRFDGSLAVDLVAAVGMAVVCVGVALLSYFAFEKPAHLWGKRLLRATNSKAMTASTTASGLSPKTK